MEPERYELREPARYRFELDRRDFFRTLGGGLLIIGFVSSLDAQESGARGRGGRQMPQDMSAWLHIAGDGSVTVYTGKVEVGQNTRTALTQAVAEELRCKPELVRLVMGDTDQVPFDMGTFGSLSTPQMAPQLHRVGAAAREALIALAAQQWSVDPAAVSVRDGRVTAAGHQAHFGELTHGKQLVRAVGSDAPVTPATKWTVCGTSVPKVDARSFVTGAHKYASDMSAPGMLYGKVLRPPSFGAKLASADVKSAQSMPGVTVVRDGEFVAVAAPSQSAASAALAAIRPEWSTSAQPSQNTLYEDLKLANGRTQVARHAGSIEAGSKQAKVALGAEYHVAYIAHTPLEPRAAMAAWEGDRLTVHTGTQRPFGVRGELAEAFSIPEERVRVIMPDTGSGYGGKHTGEAALEAARLAKAAGRPVKIVWTREEEFTWAYARPAGTILVNGAATADGQLVNWVFHNYNSGSAAILGKYEIPNEVTEFHEAKSPLRQGSYRGLAATANHFARETMMDELAVALKLDPVAFRMTNLKDERQRAVLAAAAEKFGWGGKPAEGRAYGIATGFDKGGYVATAVEIALERGKVRVARAATAFECGAIVNPDHLKNQVEGAVIMGLGGALFEALQFDNGRITNASMRQYRVPRFSDVPALETVLLDRKDIPSAGAGECPIVCIAPAIGNAIFAATGVRLRSMPLVPNGMIAGAM